MHEVETMKKQKVVAVSAAIILGVVLVMILCNPIWLPPRAVRSQLFWKI